MLLSDPVITLTNSTLWLFCFVFFPKPPTEAAACVPHAWTAPAGVSESARPKPHSSRSVFHPSSRRRSFSPDRRKQSGGGGANDKNRDGRASVPRLSAPCSDACGALGTPKSRRFPKSPAPSRGSGASASAPVAPACGGGSSVSKQRQQAGRKRDARFSRLPPRCALYFPSSSAYLHLN
ncbi:hypothetical protein MRX96_001203 [Rhipicephalus microplus]